MNKLNIDNYIEIFNRGNSLQVNEEVKISVDNLDRFEFNTLLKNNFKGYDIYLESTTSGNSIIIEKK